MSANQADPLQLLQQLAALSQGDMAMAANSQAEVSSWRGFTLKVGPLNLVFPFAGGFEVLPNRDFQAIPWSKSWVKGVSNIRGEVYTVVDLADYLGFEPLGSARNANLFLLPDTQVKSALIVDGQVSLKSFSDQLPGGENVSLPSKMLPYIRNIVREQGQDWVVLDVGLLSKQPDFLNIASH